VFQGLFAILQIFLGSIRVIHGFMHYLGSYPGEIGARFSGIGKSREQIHLRANSSPSLSKPLRILVQERTGRFCAKKRD